MPDDPASVAVEEALFDPFLVDLVTLVRIGFLVKVGDRRSEARDVHGTAGDLLRTILGARDTEAAVIALAPQATTDGTCAYECPFTEEAHANDDRIGHAFESASRSSEPEAPGLREALIRELDRRIPALDWPDGFADRVLAAIDAALAAPGAAGQPAGTTNP